MWNSDLDVHEGISHYLSSFPWSDVLAASSQIHWKVSRRLHHKDLRRPRHEQYTDSSLELMVQIRMLTFTSLLCLQRFYLLDVRFAHGKHSKSSLGARVGRRSHRVSIDMASAPFDWQISHKHRHCIHCLRLLFWTQYGCEKSNRWLVVHLSA